MTQALHEEIINEIGTQTLARFGLNIFSFNTYGAYGASVDGSVNVFDGYAKHKNNHNYFGYTFEDLDVANRNIKSAMNNEKFYFSTTDNLGEVNHPVTDVRKIDSNGTVLENYQHKVIKNTNDLFGKNNKYLENDKIVVDKNGYEKHKNELERMAQNSKNEETRKNANKLVGKLEQSEISREDANSPRTTAIKMQATQAVYHIGQAGLSDAIVVALSTLANGAVFEIKDAFQNENHTPITERIKRLLRKVVSEFNKIFKRGAAFGALDVGVGILTQIFKSISAKLKVIWTELRNSLKSVFNAIYSYVTGEIKSYQELLSAIIKGVLSALVVAGTVALETELEAFLAPLLTPVVASFVAPTLSIIVGSIAIVMTMKSVDMALNALFGVIAQRDLAKMKAAEIHALCEELLPNLIEDREKLESLIIVTYKQRKLAFEQSFSDFKNGLSNCDANTVIKGLIGINDMYGTKLQYTSFEEFDRFMLSDETFKM